MTDKGKNDPGKHPFRTVWKDRKIVKMVFEMSPAGSIRHATLIDEHGKEEKVGHEDQDSNGGTQTLENMVDIRTIKSRNHSLNSPGVPNHDTQFARKLEFVTKDGSV